MRDDAGMRIVLAERTVPTLRARTLGLTEQVATRGFKFEADPPQGKNPLNTNTEIACTA
jgi:hypothetical protein